jgi:hypothetical protein
MQRSLYEREKPVGNTARADTQRPNRHRNLAIKNYLHHDSLQPQISRRTQCMHVSTLDLTLAISCASPDGDPKNPQYLSACTSEA